MPLPTSDMVQTLTGAFNKALTSSETDIQLTFDRIDEVVGRVILTTDNLATLLNAATGNEVFILGEGTHNVSTGVTWSSLSNIKLVGRPGATVNWTGTGAFLLISSCTKIEVSNITIQLGGAAATTGIDYANANCDDCHVRAVVFVGTTAQAHIGIDWGATSGVRSSFTDCTFSGTYSIAIDANALTNSHISRNNIYNPTSHGIDISRATDVIIDDNIIYSCGGEGIRANSSVRVTIESNVIYDPASYGITVLTTTAISNVNIKKNVIASPVSNGGIVVNGLSGVVATRVAINDNVIDAGTVNYGIQLAWCVGAVVDGNTVYGATAIASIRVGYSDKIAVTGNSVNGVSTAVGFQDGVQLDNTCDYVNVSGNILVHGNVGVEVGTSTHVTITGNMMYWAGEWVTGTTVTDLTISSNFMNNGGTQGIYITTSGTRISIAGNRITGGARPINITSGSQVSIVGNEFSDTYQRMIQMTGATDLLISGNVFDTLINAGERWITCGGTRVSITKNSFFDCDSNGVEAGGSELVISDNIFQTTNGTGNLGNAIRFGASVNRVSVTGNIMKGITNSGVYANDGITDAVIANNQIYSPNAYGIYLDDPVRVIVKGNQIYDSGSHGIYIITSAAAASDLVVNGNNVSGATGYGIGIVGTATYGITDCTIEGNDAEGSTDGLYLDYVEESTVSGRYKSTAGDGIEETANCDYNLFCGIHTRGSTTGENLNGPNSQKALSL